MSPELSRLALMKIANRLRTLMPDGAENLPTALELALARLEHVATVPAQYAAHTPCMGRCLTHVFARAGWREAGRAVVVIALAIENTAVKNEPTA